MNYDGVIFDLDGTLVNSTYVWNKVDKIFFSRRKMDLPDDYHEKIMSLSVKETAQVTKNEYDIKESIEDIMKEWYDLAYEEYSKNVKLKKGVLEYLKLLKNNNIKIGLATANFKGLFEIVLKNNNIYNYFDAFICGEEMKKSKEFPDTYLTCAERLNLSPNRCIVFEDIEKGIIGAKKANMKAYAIYDEECLRSEEYMRSISDGYFLDFTNPPMF